MGGAALSRVGGGGAAAILLLASGLSDSGALPDGGAWCGGRGAIRGLALRVGGATPAAGGGGGAD
jgi:hypothetical protein